MPKQLKKLLSVPEQQSAEMLSWIERSKEMPGLDLTNEPDLQGQWMPGLDLRPESNARLFPEMDLRPDLRREEFFDKLQKRQMGSLGLDLSNEPEVKWADLEARIDKNAKLGLDLRSDVEKGRDRIINKIEDRNRDTKRITSAVEANMPPTPPSPEWEQADATGVSAWTRPMTAEESARPMRQEGPLSQEGVYGHEQGLGFHTPGLGPDETEESDRRGAANGAGLRIPGARGDDGKEPQKPGKQSFTAKLATKSAVKGAGEAAPAPEEKKAEAPKGNTVLASFVQSGKKKEEAETKPYDSRGSLLALTQVLGESNAQIARVKPSTLATDLRASAENQDKMALQERMRQDDREARAEAQQSQLLQREQEKQQQLALRLAELDYRAQNDQLNRDQRAELANERNALMREMAAGRMAMQSMMMSWRQGEAEDRREAKQGADDEKARERLGKRLGTLPTDLDSLGKLDATVKALGRSNLLVGPMQKLTPRLMQNPDALTALQRAQSLYNAEMKTFAGSAVSAQEAVRIEKALGAFNDSTVTWEEFQSGLGLMREKMEGGIRTAYRSFSPRVVDLHIDAGNPDVGQWRPGTGSSAAPSIPTKVDVVEPPNPNGGQSDTVVVQDRETGNTKTLSRSSAQKYLSDKTGRFIEVP